jgi:hypothetical protein
MGPKPTPVTGNVAAAGDARAELHPDLSRRFHDLNQPLSAISNYAQAGSHLIDNGMADTAKLKELFGKIVAQSARAATLGQELREAVTSMSREKDSS